MARMTYDDRSFMLDGRRLWIVSGSVEYFRIPAALWRDRLLKARQGGLNCIVTAVPWNFHELSEGRWDFSGDRDIVEFIQQAKDIGLYVIVRPGPYIGADWDFGGLPPWLAAKSGVQYRTNNAVFTHFYDKYFRQLLPRLAELQITRGGNIIAIQCENNYVQTTEPDRSEYLGFIAQEFRRHKLDIPILTCNGRTEPRPEGTVECARADGDGVANARKLRQFQPAAPVLTLELQAGEQDCWGQPPKPVDERAAARRALELLGAGSQFNIHPYCGGTNFAFWGGRKSGSPDSFATTAAARPAAVAEGGTLTRAYYLLRLVNCFASQFGDMLAQAAPAAASASASGVGVFTCAGASGKVTIITNNGDDAIASAKVILPVGKTLEVELSRFGAAALLHEAKLTDRHTLDFSNLMPLGLWGGNILVLHGRAGQEGVLSINGRRQTILVPETVAPLALDYAGLTVLVMNSEAAETCWHVDEKLLIGPDFVGESEDEILCERGQTQLFSVPLGEQAAVKRQKPPAKLPTARPPTSSAFKRLWVCDEPVRADLDWMKLDRPRDLAAMGVGQGYGWYRAVINAPRAAMREVFLPGCEDRASVWLNGQFVGTWGRGEGAGRSPIKLKLARGANTLVMLADNLGRFSEGFTLGEPKGVWNDIFAAAALKPAAWRISSGGEKDFARRMVPRGLFSLLPALEAQPFQVCEAKFTLRSAMPVHLTFARLPRNIIAFCNERQVGVFPASTAFGDVTLTDTRKGQNVVRLLVWGGVTAKDLATVRLFALEENLIAGGRWAFRPWTVTAGNSTAREKNLPAWFSSFFKRPPVNSPPLFARIAGAGKGQLFLNGRNLGRFWGVGPQQEYYLPESWLKDKNELLLFEEHGAAPKAVKLEFHPRAEA